MNMNEAVETYQCPGCTYGSSVSDCEACHLGDEGYESHRPGTFSLGVGKIALGLPKGFCRFGPVENGSIDIYESWESLEQISPNLKTIFSVPVWKHLDEHGNTIVRWFSPRTNAGWSSVILGNNLNKMPGAIEITQEHIDQMD